MPGGYPVQDCGGCPVSDDGFRADVFWLLSNYLQRHGLSETESVLLFAIADRAPHVVWSAIQDLDPPDSGGG